MGFYERNVAVDFKPEVGYNVPIQRTDNREDERDGYLHEIVDQAALAQYFGVRAGYRRPQQNHLPYNEQKGGNEGSRLGMGAPMKAAQAVAGLYGGKN